MSRKLTLSLAFLLLLPLTNAGAAELWAYGADPFLPLGIEVIEGPLPYILVAQKAGGVLALREDAAREPVRVGGLTKPELANLDAMNLHHEGSLLYVALGDHFAAAGDKAGLAAVDVTDPVNPVVLSAWQSEQRGSGAADVAIVGRFAYLAAMREGLHILDVSDPTDIRLAATMLPDIHFPRPNPSPIAHPRARGLAASGGLLYVANDAGGLRILDLADPESPREIGQYVNPAMGNKAQAHNNVVIEGAVAYVAADYCGVEILDVAVPSDIRQLAWWNPWGCDAASNLWFNSGGHTNGLHLDRRRKRLYVSGGDSDLIVLDVANPAAPRLVQQIGERQDGLGTWDVAVRGGRIYGAYIRTPIPFSGQWAGVRAFRSATPRPLRSRTRR